MENHSEDKAKRILEIYTRFIQGKTVNKIVMSEMYGVSQRTIQRDISDIQCFLQDQRMETGSIQEIIFDKQMGGYLLQTKQSNYISEKAVLVVCRILLESKVLMKMELFPIIRSLIALCSDDSKMSVVENLLQEGIYHYEEPQHGKKLIDRLWNLETAVKAQKYIEIRYEDVKKKEQIPQKLKPMRVMLLNYNFYLIAYPASNKIDEMQSDNQQEVSPVIYQIDKIQEYFIMEEQFV